jgi:arylsulfatase K
MKPNILVIHCDSMSGRAMGWVGHPAAHTPNLDRLAGRGVGFANNYCNSPQCVPSRASLVSGRHTHSIAAWNNFKGLEPDDPTLFADAEKAGYRVRLIGRNDYRSGSHSLGARLLAWARSAGMDRPEKNRPKAVRRDDAGRRVREHDWEQVDAAGRFFQNTSRQEEPFFCWLGFCQPHPMGGYTSSPYYLDRIDAGEVSLPPHDPLQHPVCRHSSLAKHTFEPLPDGETLAVRRHYLAMVSEVDEMVGQVLEHLDEAGLSDSTVVVFFSDHGDMQLEHRQWLKNSFYEECARVPLIMAGPGICAAGDRDDLVSLIDLRPTMADLMGRPVPAGCDGRSLAPALGGGSLPAAPVLTQYHSNMMCTGGFMVREGDWKYAAYAGYEPQLFNLAEDPDEMVNLAGTEPGKAAEMDRRLRQMVDYEQVDHLVKHEDRQCFRGWKKAVSEEEYRESLAGLWRDFGEEQAARIELWLEEGESAVRMD